jgi:hypothetical protein
MRCAGIPEFAGVALMSALVAGFFGVTSAQGEAPVTEALLFESCQCCTSGCYMVLQTMLLGSRLPAGMPSIATMGPTMAPTTMEASGMAGPAGVAAVSSALSPAWSCACLPCSVLALP